MGTVPADYLEALVLLLTNEGVACHDEGPGLSSGPIEAVKITRKVKAIYPFSRSENRDEGTVLVEGRVTEGGCAHSFRIWASPDGHFSLAAFAAASQWRFEPVKGGHHRRVVPLMVAMEFDYQAFRNPFAPAYDIVPRAAGGRRRPLSITL